MINRIVKFNEDGSIVLPLKIQIEKDKKDVREKKDIKEKISLNQKEIVL